MPRNCSVSGVILTGGESRRMGMDKAQLALEGRSFLSRIIESMHGIVDETLVIGRPSVNLSDEEAYYAEDFRKDSGPLGGIYTGLCLAKSFWTLFVPCDMPLIDRTIYERLLGARDHEGVRILGFKTKAEDSVEHFPLLVPRPYLRVTHQLLDLGEKSVKSLLKRARLKRVPLPEDEREKIRSVNTPEEYERLISQGKEVLIRL